MLDDLLQYHDLPESTEFVATVMRAVERQQQQRRRILILCGLIGAVFGAIGAWQLAEPLAELNAQLSAALGTEWLGNTRTLGGAVVMLSAVSAFAWLLLEEFLPTP